MHKKIILLIFSIVLLASCGVKRQTVSPIAKTDGSIQTEIVEYGVKHLNKPYRYAGKGPNSFDCSGFTSFVFKKFGYRLSSSSAGQAKQAPTINRKEDLRVGDLVFFEGRAHNGRVGHVGIVKEVLPNGNFLFIHSATSKGVIVSRSTEPYYASRYLHGGRVIKQNNQIVIAKKPKKAPEESIHARALIKGKSDDTKAKKPVTVKAPKTKTEQELELSQKADNSFKNDTIIIHTRPLSFPVSESSNKKEEKEKEVTLSKVATRVNNRGIPKPLKKDGGNDPLKYEVMPGDTLYSISRKHACSVDQLKQWNPNLGNTLRAGQIINIYP